MLYAKQNIIVDLFMFFVLKTINPNPSRRIGREEVRYIGTCRFIYIAKILKKQIK